MTALVFAVVGLCWLALAYALVLASRELGAALRLAFAGTPGPLADVGGRRASRREACPTLRLPVVSVRA